MASPGTLGHTLTLGVSVALAAAGTVMVVVGDSVLPGLVLFGVGMLGFLGAARHGGVAGGSDDDSDDGGCD
jgi:hypothetical protein